ncbi:MAG: hypothetical protein ABFD79_16115 [Phycisphaerales bacterium]
MKKVLLAAAILASLAVNSFGWSEWNYTGGSHSWNEASNWGGAVPTASDDPIMRDAGDGYAEVGSGVHAVGNTMWMYGGGNATLKVNGGNLALGQLRIAVDAGNKSVEVSNAGVVTLSSDSAVGQGGVGNLSVSGMGSSVNQTAGWTYIGYGGTGNITVSDHATASFGTIRGWNGSITVESGATLYTNSDTTIGENGGTVNMIINGGTVKDNAGWMYVGFGGNGNISIGDGGLLSVIALGMDDALTDNVDLSGTGAIEIRDARPDDIAFQMNWYAGQGMLTVNGGQSAVGMLSFAVDSATQYTTVTIIPEPMTLTILAIGGLLISRKK